MARVLAISSGVARGHVGLAATVPALQWLGHEVWAVPTVLLASRPGLGRLARHDVAPSDLAETLSALEADGCWSRLDAVFTGYFPSEQSVAAAADALSRVRRANPAVQVVVDPILGDAGKLYVPEATAAAIRDRLLPLADVATPNLFELQWLTGSAPSTREGIATAARGLRVPSVVVTSSELTPERIATLLVTSDRSVERSTPARAGLPNGAGDLFAGLLLGYVLRTGSLETALDSSLQALDRVLAASAGQNVLSLAELFRVPAS